MAHYDPLGEVAPHVVRQVQALAESVEDLVIVSTAPLTDSASAWLSSHGRLIPRENVGYDFFSYRRGLESVTDLTRYDEVVVCNDTYVGPLRSYQRLFADMAGRPVDFWGLSESRRISPHIQSFFVAFRPWLVSSRAFESFWSNLEPISERTKVIRRYEVGLTSFFADAGFTWGAYYDETDAERRIARHRVAWWMAHRGPLPPLSGLRAWYAEQCRAGWNPAVGLADVALDDGRLPYVKLDTLRYDPYGLGSAKLLSLCEDRFPEAFDGVRDHLDATRTFYRPRTKEALRPTPAALRPFRRLVEYGRAA
jgi:hypothetical protein